VRIKCLMGRLVHLWGARAKHAVLMRISSHMLPQRAVYFSDAPTRNYRSWPTPRPRRAVCALLKTRNRLDPKNRIRGLMTGGLRPFRRFGRGLEILAAAARYATPLGKGGEHAR